MIFFKYFGLFLCACLPFYAPNALAQTAALAPDSFLIAEVTIQDSASRSRANEPTYRNSTTQALATLLATLPSIALRQYGVSGIATISKYGLNPAQTDISLFGVPINSPLLGLTDLNQFILQPGFNLLFAPASTATNASSVQLDYAPFDHKTQAPYQHQLAISFGSWAARNASYATSLRVGKGRLTAMGSYGTAKNNYPFQSEYILGRPSVRQQNAATRQASGLLQVSIPFNLYHKLQLHSYLASNQRQIPPPASKDNSSEALSTLDFINSAKLVSNTKALGHSELQASWYRAASAYTISESAQAEDYNYNQLATSFAAERAITSAIELSAGISQKSIFTPPSSKVGSQQYHHHNAFLGSTIYVSPHFSLLPKAQLIYFRGLHFAPSLSLQRSEKSLLLAIGYSRLFRPPTINDLYWPIYGRPETKPEHGHKFEASATWTPIPAFTISAQPFYINYNRYIAWQPVGNIFTPTTLLGVTALGIDIQSSHKHIFSKAINFTSTAGGTVQQSGESSNARSIIPFPNSQIIYTPSLLLFATTAIQIHSFSFSANAKFTGQRFISSDNTNTLPHYSLLNTNFSYIVRIANNQNLAIGFGIVNILNQRYQSVANYPMPSRSFLLTFKYEI